MSGGSIPYHQRVNKAIERNLFVELLRYVDRYRPMKEYSYVGMGGPFLDDFKVLHGAFRMRRMISVESSQKVLDRQRFNAPFSGIQFENARVEDYILRADFSEPTIMWLDFTSTAWICQLDTVRNVVARLKDGDILKVTMNANPESIHKDLVERLPLAEAMLGEYAPSDMAQADLKMGTLPDTLLKAIHSACRMGIGDRTRHVFQPISAFNYADGQQMMTACGVVLDDMDADKFIETTEISEWCLFNKDWSGTRAISVPELSARERLAIEAMLPDCSAETILERLNFHVADNNVKSKAMLENFADFHLQYPMYSRVQF